MEDQYGMPDLRQYINGRPLFPAISPPTQEILSGHHRSLTAAAAQQHYEMVMMGGRQQGGDISHHHGLHHQEFQSDSATVTTSIVSGGTPNSGFSGGLDMEGSGGVGGGDGGTGRWPRQETLTLLEIRSRLDSKFKEANQKGPLWDEVSRIMSEEHGYQRSGKKCREKFENLYKYYKKTKEGKAGRQDGKNYRFFRQLEAIYGESTTPPAIEAQLAGSSFRYNVATNMNNSAPNQEPFSLSDSSDFDTTSSDDSDVNVTMENDSMGKRKKRSKRSWKAKVKDFIDAQMKKLMDKQEAWLEKMMKTIENREQERLIREEAWRKREEARIEKEHQFWAKERAWIEARDTALMETLQKVTGKEFRPSPINQKEFGSEVGQDSFSEARQSLNGNPNQNRSDSWLDCEVTRLIQLRTIMESRFNHQVGCTEIFWEEISSKMSSFGYERSPLMCKEKWNSINDYLIKCNRNAKDNSINCYNVQSHEGVSYCNVSDQQGHDSIRLALNDHSSSQPNCSTSNNTMHEGCFRYFMADAENLWENYGFKQCKGDNN